MTQNTPTGWEGILDEGETILWQGRPDTQIVWSSLLSFQSFFGLFFGGFAAFWISMALLGVREAGGIFILFPLFGVPFLLAGLYSFIGHIFWNAYVRGRSWYTLTDRAAYIATEIFGKRRLKTYPYADMQPPELQDNTPGSVIFAEDITVHSNRRRGRTRRLTQRVPVGFMRIDDARAVYRILSDRRKAALAHDNALQNGH